MWSELYDWQTVAAAKPGFSQMQGLVPKGMNL